MSLNIEHAWWSPEKQQGLQSALIGFWAEDVWEFRPRAKGGLHSICFTPLPLSLRIEFKYALWHRFDTGDRSLAREQHNLCYLVRDLIRWFSQEAPAISSLLEKSLEYWDVALRSWLVQANQLRPKKVRRLSATQEYQESYTEDMRIRLIRQFYAILLDAYDDRPETEKDLWDLCKLGLKTDLTLDHHHLNFAPISQPWLRGLAKEYMQYNMALFSAGDCYHKLWAIRFFSRFLAQYDPTLQPPQIDRALIVRYIAYLSTQGATEETRRRALSGLRSFFECCTHRLTIAAFSKEQLIFREDFPKEPEALPREIPEEVLEQLREHLAALPTTLLRMVTILLECGMRISELCTLPLDCLKCDDRHEWYLSFYLWKRKKEHTIPLVNQTVIEAIQAQQAGIKAQWGVNCRFLFPSPRSSQRPFQQKTFNDTLNVWALKANIRDRSGALYHFQSHQFRHTVGMRLINDDVPLDTISRLFGHDSLQMTQRYAYKRADKLRAELQRVGLKRKTIDFHGQTVKGDPVANGVEPQLLRKGIRGQTLPVGGCGRMLVMGPCAHENKCLTCVFWLTSTEDLPALKAFRERAIRLRQHAAEAGNQVVVTNQDRIIPLLQLRITNLENTSNTEEALSVEELLSQLRTEAAEMETGLEEAREANLVIALKQLERRVAELKAQIAALEGTP